MLPSLIQPDDLKLLAEMCADSPLGNVVELGVYQGGSAQVLYDVCQKQGRTLYLFDTFAGHTLSDDRFDDVRTHHPGRFADCIAPDRLKALLPEAIVTIGTFPDTMRYDMQPLAFVHSDMDLYWPTRAVCTLLPPLMVDGGRIWFDDYGYPECPGVKQAVDAAFPEYARCIGKPLITITHQKQPSI